jgi:hypothetical protein
MVNNLEYVVNGFQTWLMIKNLVNSFEAAQHRLSFRQDSLERAKGIEPSYAAWEAAVLPLNYARERPQQ